MIDGITEGYLNYSNIMRDKETGLFFIQYEDSDDAERYYLTYNNSFSKDPLDCIDFQSNEDAIKYKQIILGYPK